MINKIAKINDYATILGGYSVNGCGFYKAVQFDRTKIWSFKNDGSFELLARNDRQLGIRPEINYEAIKDSARVVVNSDDYLLVEYGEMPQNLPNEYVDVNNLEKTGRQYTTDSKKNLYSKKANFKPERHDEYSYNGKRYVFASRAAYPYNKNDLDYSGFGVKNKQFKLSNGLSFSTELPILLEVRPILWYVDKASGIATTINIVIAGIRDVDAMHYLNNYFFKEITYDYEKNKMVGLGNKKVKVRSK